MGKVQAIEFISYEATLERFLQEWAEIVKLNAEVFVSAHRAKCVTTLPAPIPR